MPKLDWGDIKFVLAVAEQGSLSGAARALNVNHATVLRRVTQFEENMGFTLFDRTARGYRVAPRRRKVLEAMAEMEAAARGVERAITAARSPLAGMVRITSTDSLCLAVLPEIVARLQSSAEGLTIELNATNLRADLSRLDADIAVRPTQELPPELTGNIAADMGFDIYGAPEGGPGYIGTSGPLNQSMINKWMSGAVPEADIIARADSFVVMREMAARGVGRAVLPVMLGDPDPRLSRLGGGPDIRVPIWVASHVDLAEVPRIRIVRDMLAKALKEAAPLLGSPTET